MVIRYRVAAVALLGACSFKAPTELDATPPPTIAFEFDKSGADEQVGTVMVPIVLSKPSVHQVTAKVSVLAGGSADDADFELMVSEVAFEPNVTRVMVPVAIKPDLDETESEEIFTLAISDPVGAELDLEKAIHEVKIADHLLPRVKFAQLATSTMEDTPSTLRIELTAPSEGESTVMLGVEADGTTVDSEDLAVNADTVITIPNGATFVDIPLGENNDALDEADTETIAFALRGASQNLVLGTDIAATHTIIDNDDPPTVEFMTIESTANESDGTVTIAVKLSGESGLPITVNYARNANSTTNNNDATVNGTQLTFNPHLVGIAGDTLKTFTVTINDDNTDEDAEQLLIDLTTATNATIDTNKNLYTLTIAADPTDVPTVEFDEPDDQTNEQNGNTESVRFKLSAASTKNVTVPFTISGTANRTGGGADYDISTLGPVVINAGQTQSAQITITVRGDNSKEQNETVILTMGTPTNAIAGNQKTYTCTIIDND